MHRRYVHPFGTHTIKSRVPMRDLLGDKGSDLEEMTVLGLPVPPGFTLTTEACARYQKVGRQLPNSIKMQVVTALRSLEKSRGADFGSKRNPLFLSVRSGARVPTPGMVETILNLGLNGMTVESFAKVCGDRVLAWSAYRSLVSGYGTVVLGVDATLFEAELKRLKETMGSLEDKDLTAEDWEKVTRAFLDLIQAETSQAFPQDTMAQLWGAIGAVFESWNMTRSITYWRLRRDPDDWGTAVIIQSMVFGNLGATSGVGLVSIRNLGTEGMAMSGRYCINAQAEDVFEGTHLMLPLNRQPSKTPATGSMEEAVPKAYEQLMGLTKKLGCHFGGEQEIPFLVEKGRLFIPGAATRNPYPPSPTQISRKTVVSALMGG